MIFPPPMGLCPAMAGRSPFFVAGGEGGKRGIPASLEPAGMLKMFSAEVRYSSDERNML